MMRGIWACVLIVATAACVLAQEGALEVAGAGGADVRYEPVDYTRELWVGLKPQGVEARDMLNIMRDVCDDTTAVGVIEVKPAGNKEEREFLASVSAKEALAHLNPALGIEREYTRVVLVGVFETCVTALRIARDEGGYADGLVLIDPPVGDLVDAEIPESRRVGVDVVLHPRSDAEFERHGARLIDHLGHWGSGARILRGEARFGTLRESLGRVWNTVRGYTVEIEGARKEMTAGELAARLDEFDVVFVGELHGNPGAHRVELEFLRHFIEGDRAFALATEQWERDTQAHLDAFLAGGIDEPEFVDKSRAWPNYADYRPLVHLCKDNGVPVIAGNIPRPLANRVFKEGTEVLDEFTDEEKSWTAESLDASPGAYKRKFMGVMGGRSERLERMYAAQCIKDDTMAESVARWLNDNPGARVLHINGSFHSAEGLGAAEKLMTLNPDLKVAMVTCVQEGEDFQPAPDEWVVRVPASRPRRVAAVNPHE